MRAPSSLKQEFLKKWILGLQICSSSSKNMSIFERKKAIKLSADVAMASARNGRTCWSRALITKASNNDKDKALVEHMLGNSEVERLKKIPMRPTMSTKRIRCKKILKRSCGTIRRVSKRSLAPQKIILANSVAKRLSKKRTQVLKSLVPGGEFMDDVSLIEETLDYIMSLQAQIDVMRSLANATQVVLNRKKEKW